MGSGCTTCRVLCSVTHTPTGEDFYPTPPSFEVLFTDDESDESDPEVGVNVTDYEGEGARPS
jgi:hypothetical protein